MAEEDRLKENQFDKVGVNPFNAPIPGESLTDSPDTPKAWEICRLWSEHDYAYPGTPSQMPSAFP